MEKKDMIGRQEAMKLGLKSYFTGKPCKNGMHPNDYARRIGLLV